MSDELTPEQILIDNFDELFFENDVSEARLLRCLDAYVAWRAEIAEKSLSKLRDYLKENPLLIEETK